MNNTPSSQGRNELDVDPSRMLLIIRIFGLILVTPTALLFFAFLIHVFAMLGFESQFLWLLRNPVVTLPGILFSIPLAVFGGLLFVCTGWVLFRTEKYPYHKKYRRQIIAWGVSSLVLGFLTWRLLVMLDMMTSFPYYTGRVF